MHSWTFTDTSPQVIFFSVDSSTPAMRNQTIVNLSHCGSWPCGHKSSHQTTENGELIMVLWYSAEVYTVWLCSSKQPAYTQYYTVRPRVGTMNQIMVQWWTRVICQTNNLMSWWHAPNNGAVMKKSHVPNYQSLTRSWWCVPNNGGVMVNSQQACTR